MFPALFGVSALHSGILAILAMIVGFAGYMTAFNLAGRSREASAEGRSGWLFLAAISGGAGLWSGHALLFVAAAGGTNFHSSLMLVALFAAVATTLFSFTIQSRIEGLSGAILAGACMAVGAVLVDVIGIIAATGSHIPSRLPLLSLIAFAGALTLTLAAYVASHRRAEDDRPSGLPALFMALSIGLSNSLFLGATILDPAAPLMTGVDIVGPQSVAVFIAAIMFLVVGSGMATALIDREGQYASQRRLRQLADSSVEGLVIVKNNRIVETNESFAKIVGTPAADLRERDFLGTMLWSDADRERTGDQMLWEGQLMASDHRRVPVEVVARPIDYEGAEHTVYAVRDLSARRDAELRIRFLAEHDVLTGLPNRASFQRELELACARVRAGITPFALFCLDLDRFKEANDVFGHAAGDYVLAQAAARLTDLLGPTAFIARLGGDEFVVLSSASTTTRQVAEQADTIVSALSKPYIYNDNRILVGCSAGIALSPNDGNNAEVLLARADMALYRAKAEGRGTYCFFEQAMDEETRLRRQLAFDLRDAIDRDQLELYYQPLADLTSSKIVGFEALARWHHPIHGVIAPTIFIAIAEESGFIAQLGEWVLRTACNEAGKWETPLRIAVNLSPIQLEQQSLPDIVHDILLKSGMTPARLELEVTETALMRNPQRALDVLRRIKALGVRIAMDDFGTGYSSLSTLQSFPFDKLKIDRSFVDRVGTHEQAESIVRAVVGLSRSLSISVVAEGVENQTQIEFLTGEECDEVQGFMIGRPLPIESYRHLIGGKLLAEGEAKPAPATAKTAAPARKRA